MGLSIDCAFIEYTNNSAAYRFIVIKSAISDIHVNTIIELVDAELRRGKMTKNPKNFGHDYLTFLSENEPQTYQEAMTSPDAPFWKEAINSKMEFITKFSYSGIG